MRTTKGCTCGRRGPLHKKTCELVNKPSRNPKVRKWWEDLGGPIACNGSNHGIQNEHCIKCGELN